MRKHVLVVDDDAAILAMLTQALKARGHEVTPCADGASALARIRAGRFDAGVFDIQMPGASGVDVLRRFRERQPKAPAFVVSGAITSATLETVDALGARSFDKPFDLAQVCDAVSEAAADSADAHPWSILVVDDEPAVLKLLRPFLAGQGYAVTTAGDGAEALRAVRAAPRPFDVALVDINMPNLNGVSFIREMDAVAPETLPVIMTGEATSQQVMEAYYAGAETLVRKPFDLTALQNFVEALEVTIHERRARAGERKSLALRGPLEKARDEIRETWTARGSTRRSEVRTYLLVGAGILVLLWVGLAAWVRLEDQYEQREREARALLEGTNQFLRASRDRLIVVPQPGAPAPASGLDPEQMKRMEDFLQRVEGYLQRDENRELQGTDGPVPAGKQEAGGSRQ